MQQSSELRHEFVDGQIFPMAEASPNHGRISANLMRHFGNHLENPSCEPFSSDMLLKSATGKYRYPDILVSCDDNFIDDGAVTQTPIIVEVIARSTRKIDESVKKLEYIRVY